MAAYRRNVFCRVRVFCRTFSQLYLSTFDAMPIDKRLVHRLNDLNIKTPTEIQKKSCGAIINGDNVIINAETGSGKTLCYLIHVLDSLFKPPPRKPASPSALVLVPNMDLGYQIIELFNILCDPGYSACPVHRDSQLHINEQYPLLVSTPQALLQYDMSSLATVQTIIVDEADLIIANGGKSFWKLLRYFKERSNLKSSERDGISVLSESRARQFIFVAATLPRRGEKSVLKKITKWLPDVVLISTPMVHQYVPTVTSLDVSIEEEEKLPQLLKHLNICRFDSVAHKNHLNVPATSQQNKQLRILVFANTITMAKQAFEFLNRPKGTTFEVLETKSNRGGQGESHVLCQHRISEDLVESYLVTDKNKIIKSFSTKTGSTLPWRGQIGVLHKEVSMSERREILKKFEESEIVVLVSTDLASRGLDIPDISHVIQLDYAQNAADVLHRAGRTARAGAQGIVINFVTQKDQDLLQAIKLSKKGPGAEGFQDVFSRNRMFSRRRKRKI